MRINMIKHWHKPTFELLELKPGQKCPICGECRNHGSVIIPGQGIVITKRTWFSGIFNIKKHSVETYTCYTCKSEWEVNQQDMSVDFKIVRGEEYV